MKQNKPAFNWVALFIVLAVSLIVIWPLMRPGFFVTDDGNWMVIRLSAFYQSFREGQFPVRFLGRLNNSFGYPVANFLYPGFMYIGSILRILGISFVNIIKILLAGSVITITGFTYLWLKRRFSKLSSVVGAISVGFAPYLLFDIYTRGSVGEVLAIAWASMGMYCLSAKKTWLFGLAIALLIVSHNSLALVFIGFFAAYITVFQLWREFRIPLLFGVGMATFFWFPALYEQKYVIFSRTPVSNPADYFITLSNFTLLGAVGFVAGVIALVSRGGYAKEKLFFIVVSAVMLFMVLPFSTVLWNIPLLARVIQFPYRLLSVGIIVGAYLAAYAVEYRSGFRRIVLLVVFAGLALWGAINMMMNISYVNEPEGFYTTNEGTTTVHGEYMPRWVSVVPAVRTYDRIMFYSGRGSIGKGKVTTQSIDTTVTAVEDSVIQINTMYYPGWGVTVDNIPVTINYHNPAGLMRIPVMAGTHHIVAGFRETISRFLADFVSLGFVVWFIVLGILSILKKKKTS